ncbi:MAG: pilus assembly protein PilM [Elusimicrobia bacterium]|nr:pilus assembly protein PilM [Elusimicrobiota bacterium]
MFGTKIVTSLDLGATAVKIVQLKKTSKGWTVLQAIKKEIPLARQPNEQERRDFTVAFLNEFFAGAQYGIKTGIVLSINRNSAIVKFIKLPSITEDEINKMLPFEVEKHVPVSLGKVVISSQITGREVEDEKTYSNIAVVMVRRDIIDEQLKIIGAAGLKAALIGLSSFGLYNRFKQLFKDNLETNAIIEIGTHTMEIDIISGGALKFSRSAPIGGATLSQMLQKVLVVDPQESERLKREEPVFDKPELREVGKSWGEKLLHEINQSLDSFRLENKKKEIARLLLSGGGSKLPGLKEFLEQKLNIPVGFLGSEPGAQESQDEPWLENETSFPVALGLADQGTEKVLAGINLLPPEILDSRIVAKQKKLMLFLTVIAGGSLLYMAGTSYLNLVSKKRQIKEIDLELAASKNEVELARYLQKKNELYSGWLADRTQVLAGLRQISLAAPPEIYVDHLVYDSHGQVVIRGQTRSYETVTKFILQLDQTRYFAKVAMKESRAAQYGNQSLIEFIIDCQLKDTLAE